MARPRQSNAQRIIDGTVDAVGMVGLRRLTMDDVARSAGLARVTLYKHFPGKDEVLEAAMLFELQRFLGQVEDVIRRGATPEESLTDGFAVAIGLLRTHPVIAHLMRTEPEALMPYLAGTSPVIVGAQAWATEQIRGTVPAARLRLSAESAGELLMRTVHSVTFNPGQVYDLDDADAVRAVARDWLLPAIVGDPA